MTGRTARKGWEGLRWYVGVPIATNPLILVDMGTILALLWIGGLLSVVLIQLLTARTLTGAQVQGAAAYATYLILFVAGAFLLVTVLLRNRYVALYRFDDEGAYCETIRKGRGPLQESLHWRPFPVDPIVKPARSTKKSVPWGHVHTVQPMAGSLVLLLRAGRGTAMRVYCPDEGVFEKALHYAQMRLSEGRSARS